MTTISEADVEQAALDWLSALGWKVAHGPDIAPDTPGTVKGGEISYHVGVAVQDKCPVKWPAEMSLGQAAIVSDDDVEGPSQACRVGGPSAARYFLMVALWIPNSRSIALSDIPLRLAF